MENKYYLAVETKPKNYFPINLLDLKISPGYIPTKIEELDAFTLKYTKEEIMSAIREANIIELDEEMPLVIIYHEKNMVRKTQVLFRDLQFDMWQDIKDHYQDKLYVNKIYNFLNKKIDDEKLKELRKTESLKDFLYVINSLSYLIQRKLYFYLYEK